MSTQITLWYISVAFFHQNLTKEINYLRDWLLRGVSQIKGADYDKTFCLLVRMESLRTVVEQAIGKSTETPLVGCYYGLFKWRARGGCSYVTA